MRFDFSKWGGGRKGWDKKAEAEAKAKDRKEMKEKDRGLVVKKSKMVKLLHG